MKPQSGTTRANVSTEGAPKEQLPTQQGNAKLGVFLKISCNDENGRKSDKHWILRPNFPRRDEMIMKAQRYKKNTTGYKVSRSDAQKSNSAKDKKMML